MLMPKKNLIAIYELLFKEGVMVAKKDVHMPKHPELADKNVPNLHVMKAMQSLKSRGYVKEQFAWRHFYWYLTNEGIQYLRDYLHLPPEIVPATLRRSRPETGRPRPPRSRGTALVLESFTRGLQEKAESGSLLGQPANLRTHLEVVSGTASGAQGLDSQPLKEEWKKPEPFKVNASGGGSLEGLGGFEAEASIVENVTQVHHSALAVDLLTGDTVELL
ncbi:40S ribosomal protein S10 [Sigmodon hispidus]